MVLGALFATPMAPWIYFAFVKPPCFGRSNASRYYDGLKAAALCANNEELGIVAQEIRRSARKIIKHAKQFDPAPDSDPKKNSSPF